MKEIRILALLLFLPGLGFSMPASALANVGTYAFLKNTPAELFSDEDWKLFEDSLNSALDGAADGETKTWANPNGKVSGEITLVKSVKKGGTDCRRVRVTNQAKDRKRTSGAIFCKQPDGGWKTYTGKK